MKSLFQNRPVMNLRHLLSAMLVCLSTAFIAGAVSPYPSLEAKAMRFFDHKEWASASAMFDLMLEERPEVAQTYGRAIVSNGMTGNKEEQTRLMTKALDNHIPFDSVFSGVKEWSFHIGQPQLFENFLLDTRTAHPWMQRTINVYLLKYYTMRHNGPEIIAYSRTMLDGAPDNIMFLTLLAEGYMLDGNTGQGIDTYRHILSLSPDNYNTLLTLGNWYAAKEGEAATALTYLERADSLRPTPYVTALITRLRKQSR